MKTEIIPAILPKNFAEIEQKLSLLKSAFLILSGEQARPVVQIDICDGKFVPNKTWPFTEKNDTVRQLEKFADDFDFEIDLMVQNPENYFSALKKVGNIKRIIIHDLNSLGCPTLKSFQFGLAIKSGTPVEKIMERAQNADFVQFMGIDKIGYQGQQFNSAVIAKIQEFHKQNPNVIISVDGGVNLENAQDLVGAGARRLVVGSAIFQNNDAQNIMETIQKLWR